MENSPARSTTPEERLRALPTAAVSDALDSLGIAGQMPGIATRNEPGRAVAGRAFTVRYEPVDSTGGTVGDFLDDVEPGQIVVIDNQGRSDCTVWGGIMSRTAASRGIAGTVIDGTCRDLAASREAGYPLWSASVYMRTGKDRVRIAETQGTLRIGEAEVAPGDFVMADADGALCIPAARIDEVLELAERIESTEQAIARTVLEGSTLADARERFAYHSLQSAVRS
ncbi:RraA family protein [Brachybacterium sp. ACRRE]|uniref:RraA family protein n=1 Tax=Brachybacterium sp. ACRRE TaxID=2918184 RepID=UPI001EF23029|nr:RraA family protein [Brachybacterium sp. ACRRE]MCG7310340.1 RraA family protein [Brachybacterium sp. ACRRE]